MTSSGGAFNETFTRGCLLYLSALRATQRATVIFTTILLSMRSSVCKPTVDGVSSYLKHVSPQRTANSYHFLTRADTYFSVQTHMSDRKERHKIASAHTVVPCETHGLDFSANHRRRVIRRGISTFQRERNNKFRIHRVS